MSDVLSERRIFTICDCGEECVNDNERTNCDPTVNHYGVGIIETHVKSVSPADTGNTFVNGDHDGSD
ncbi:MAG: hypothetical protein Hyperionvirus40_12 [Hyperionvirus sp.]|uniref:Uncharacterized protein n=1 Tax=Hyperionvirus sp. TaxID=2487770 RepID=A0A3G5AC30_9VIRU|nr:MAG: hypothetical protein Hyperionvirus40_12 [Hyperionvirus sp.]